MSQKVSSILFNNYTYNNSKWFITKNKKFALNEDLQLREIISILFKNNINSQYLFVDRVVTVKYYSHVKIYIYFFCNFNYFKRNILRSEQNTKNNYLTIFYLYYKYIETLNSKKIEILKILRTLFYNDNLIYLYFKNINYIYNSENLFLAQTISFSQKTILKKIKLLNRNSIQYVTSTSNLKKYEKKKLILKSPKFSKNNQKIYKRFINLQYFKTIHFLLYILCYANRFQIKINITSIINIIYYELNSLDNTLKNYNFLFYTMFNLIREILSRYLKDESCKIKGIRFQIKGRYFLTKRKRVFVFNLGNLNLNKINLTKDYASLNLIKSTGSSSIKIWINYK